MSRLSWRRVASCALISLVLACQDGFEDFSVVYFGLEIQAADSVVFRERTQSLIAIAPCSLPNPCLLLSGQVTWSTSNSARATVSAQGVVTGGTDTGAVYIRATFQSFVDSLFLRVVDRGSFRWRSPLSGDVSTAPATVGVADTALTVLVVHGGGGASGLLRRASLDGSLVWEVPTCPAGSVGPSSAGLILVSGPACTEAHAPGDGDESWTLSLGLADAGAAQRRASNWLVTHVVPSGGSGEPEALAVSRFSALGVELRRDTVFSAPSVALPTATPAVAANGGPVLAWLDNGTPVVGAFDSLGARLFLDTLSAYPAGRSLSFGANGAILVGTDDGLFALDPTGGLAWSAGGTGDNVSSPVGDSDGNVYALAAGGLASYASDGQLRWFADSLGSGSAGLSPAPVVLSNGELVSACKGNQYLCWVDRETGGVLGSLDMGARTSATPAVAPDGTVIVVLGNVGQNGPGLPALLAVYGREGPLTVGWPAEGRTIARSRSLLP